MLPGDSAHTKFEDVVLVVIGVSILVNEKRRTAGSKRDAAQRAIDDLIKEEQLTMSPHCLCYPFVYSFRNCQSWATSNINGWCRFLAICVFSVGLFVLPAPADDWVADFETGFPAGWAALGVNVPTGDPSPTFAATIESGVLRLRDSQAAVDGGSFGGLGGVATSVFTDVRVSAVVNVAQDSNGDLGVLARTDLNEGTAYFGNIDLVMGQACIAKVSRD